MLCVLLGGRTSSEGKDSVGALLAAGGETSLDEAAGAKALCGRDLKCRQKHF